MTERAIPAIPGLPRFIADASFRRVVIGWASFVVAYGFTVVVVALG